MAEQELSLLIDTTSELRWTVRARSTTQPPLLDGKLDELFWQQTNKMELTDFDNQSSATQIRWAYDPEYLYVGIVVPSSVAQATPVVQHREYDADLQGVDHVHLLLDTDRDYCTAVELAIAADGRTFDRCCGYREYNPKWHVSVGSQSEQWTAELAIRLDDLTGHDRLWGRLGRIGADCVPTELLRAGRDCELTRPIFTRVVCCSSNPPVVHDSSHRGRPSTQSRAGTLA